jgi:hypothetical protein
MKSCQDKDLFGYCGEFAVGTAVSAGKPDTGTGNRLYELPR